MFFIPIGALILTWLFLRIFKSWRSQKQNIYKAFFLGWASHGILDICTSYGTMYLWPFSYERYAWNNLSIVDFFFTFSLLAACILGRYYKKRSYPFLGLGICLAYAFLGYQQNLRALDHQIFVSQHRQHQVVNRLIQPTLTNIKIWRSVYETKDGFLHADKIIVPFFGKPILEKGDKKKRVKIKDLLQSPRFKNSNIKEQLRFYNSFTKGYLTWVGNQGDETLGDSRYSRDPKSLNPIWALRIKEQPNQKDSFELQTVFYRKGRSLKGYFKKLWKDLKK